MMNPDPMNSPMTPGGMANPPYGANPNAQIPESQRASILERLVPSLGFTVAAMSGALGAILLLRFLGEMKRAEAAGYAAFFAGMSEIEVVIGVVLGVAAMLGGIGILVSIIRLFTTNTTSSPPGILLLALGLLSVIPPFAMHYMLHVMKGVVANPVPGSGGISAIAGKIDVVSYSAIGSAGLITLILLAFSFIPFTSRSGRKASTLICLILVEILVVFLCLIFFWEFRTSLIERDKDRSVEELSQPRESPTITSEPVQIPGIPRDMIDSVTNSNSAPSGKTVSGGVLNGKAIELPQPTYPPAARAVRASGTVTVQVTVNTNGEVVSAQAVSGHPLLRASAVQAARKARFTPTMLSGQPVNVSGVLTYNFSAPAESTP